MATMLCDHCGEEVEADTLTTLKYVDVLKTVCQKCKPTYLAIGFVIVFSLEEGDDNA